MVAISYPFWICVGEFEAPADIRGEVFHECHQWTVIETRLQVKSIVLAIVSEALSLLSSKPLMNSSSDVVWLALPLRLSDLFSNLSIS